MNKSKLSLLYPWAAQDEPEANAGSTPNGTPAQETLASVSNTPGAKDVYGNSSWMKGSDSDRLAISSPQDPAAWENPDAGAFHAAAPVYCNTCKTYTDAQSIAAPSHLGHDTQYADRQNFDVAFQNRAADTSYGVASKTGNTIGGSGASGSIGADSYRIDWKSEPNAGAYSPAPLESSYVAPKADAPVTPNTFIDMVEDNTTPM